MRSHRSTSGLFASTLVGASLLTPLSVYAQDEQDQGVLLDIRYAGLAEVEPHSKDADAHRALMMLGERLAEIPGETDGPQEAREGIELLWELLRGNSGLRVMQSNEAPGVSIAFSHSPADPTSGEAYLSRLVDFAKRTGGPIELDERGHFVQSPVGPVRVDTANDGGTVSIRMGTDSPASTDVQPLGLSADVFPLMSGRIDLQGLGQLIAQIASEEEPDIADLLEEYPWIIGEAPVLEFAYGNDDTHQIITSRMFDSKEWLSKLGTDPSVTFTREEMAAIPQDATVAVGFPFSLDFMLGFVDMAAAESGEDPFAELEEMLGFDVRGDVLENLGPRFVFYQADSTGGGGFLSSVLMCEVQDADAFARAHSNLRTQFNDFTGEQARGYIRVRAWEVGGHDVFTLVTPGLPVPIEPSWSLVGDQLVMAGSPIGLSAAIDQLDARGGSVLDNPKFSSAVLDIMPGDEVASFAFSDTERFAKQGYAGVNYLLSALSNAVRSPRNPDREAGMLTPAFASFVEGIEPRGTISYWEGDDYVSLSRLDGSILVETAEAFGYIGSSQGAIAGGAMGMGILLPALGKARESAQQMKGASQVRALCQAMMVYASANDGAAPESLEQLIDEGYITFEMLESPFGPVYDDMGDIVMRTDLDDERLNSFRSDLVICIDRAMYLNGTDTVNIGFADGHVEMLPYWEVDEILDAEINEGIRENLNIE